MYRHGMIFFGLLTVLLGSTLLFTKTVNAAEVQRKPRIIVILDTSGSMAFEMVVGGGGTNGDGSNDPWTGGGHCCAGDGNSRLYTAKNAIRSVVLATGEIEFALMTFPQGYDADDFVSGLGSWQYDDNQGAGSDSLRYWGGDHGGTDGRVFSGVTFNNHPTEPTINMANVEDYPAVFGDPLVSWWLKVGFVSGVETYTPAEIAMWTDHHEFSRDPANYGEPDSNPLSGDGTEQEVRAHYGTPLGRSLLAADAYLREVQNNDNAYVQTCRPYSVVLLADGDESGGYEAPGWTPAQAANLLNSHGFKTWVIGVAGGTEATLDNIAANGGTTEAFFANNESELRDALFQIVSETIQIEVCNDSANPSGPPWDEDCDCPGDGLGAGDTNSDGTECGPGDDGVNEGFTLFCDQQGAPVGYETELRYCADPGETVCDGLDDNCDGTTDVPPPTGWPLGSGVGDDCYDPSDAGCTGPPGACTGACRFGAYACESGSLVCTGDIHPAAGEQCDGVDEDCDGLVDDEDDLNEYSITGVAGCGICGDGEERCVDYGVYATMECCATSSAFGACDPVQIPVDEICNGADDNCNGTDDEGNPEGGVACFPTPEYAGCAIDGSGCVGECAAGVTVCDFGCTAGVDLCIGDFVCQNAVLPAPEVCDGLDNDCDGDPTDDGTAELNLGQTCPSDTHPSQGECVAGKWECQTGSMICKPDSGTEIIYPKAEICDGLDNDCDGLTDEDLFQACGGCDPMVEVDCTGDANEGLCQQGIQYCDPDNAEPASGSGPAWLACQNSIAPVAEECNGLDDDCDGTVDDGLTDEGECEGADPVGCPGFPGDVCPDGRDQGNCVSGDLFCNPSGRLECGGAIVNPVPETCDGADQDCDGSVDENLWQECFTGAQGCAGGPLVCVGQCKAGQQTCNAGSWGTWDGPVWQNLACDGEIVPVAETCNGLDDDCDGTPDNNLTDGWLGDSCGTGVCTGTYICGPTGKQECDMPVQPGSQPEACDGVDNDCDGRTDEGLFQECWTEAYPITGICHHGVQQCVFLTGDPGDPNYPWGACQGEVTPADQEACNGLDDDCDGSTDEEDEGLASPWHEVCNVCDDEWECVAGELVCEMADPQPEICDGEDNDCDGLTDEVTQDCGGCLPSLYPECEDGQDPNLGVCQEGTKQCSYVAGLPEDELNWGDCAGDVGPSNEICDGLDNDCDCPGDTWGDGIECNHLDDNVDEEDEIWSGGLVPCMDAVGECEAAVLRCVVDTESNVGIECCASVNPVDGTCIPPQGPGFEICDGLDNDCDGLTDEALTEPCGGCDSDLYPGFDCLAGADAGECQEGVSTCVHVEDPGEHPDWPWSACVGDTGPVAESCNLLDDDCDGQTDNAVVFNPPDCGLTATDDFDEGECVSGLWVCNDDGNAECDGAKGPTLETCDGLDNDCDGNTDEDLPEAGQLCATDIGLCEYGLTACVEVSPDDWDFDCLDEVGPQKEVCDGFDNDCDGQTDEELGFGATCTNSPTKKPEGECDEGVEECINGKWECNANWPSPEICDGLDNDCDGSTDEGLEVDCPDGSICIQGECADECTAEELSCPMGETCQLVEDKAGNEVWACVSDVCDESNEDALACVLNTYWCSDGWEPICVCDAARNECVNICENVNCPPEKVCIPTDGTCQFLQDDCWTQGCVEGSICVDGKCVDDPCFEVVCKENQYCNSKGICADSCMLEDCPDDQGCLGGECSDDLCLGVKCEMGEDCDPKTGNCINDGPCAEIRCKFYEICVDGDCIGDPCWNVECPNGFQCAQGGCYEFDISGDGDADSDSDSDNDTDSNNTDTDVDTNDTSDTATSPQTGDEVLNDVLATGVGGCLCSTTPGSGQHRPVEVAVMLLGLLALVMRFARRRDKGIVRVLILLGAWVLVVACHTSPYDFGGDATDMGTSTDGDSDSDSDSDTDDDSDSDSDTEECNKDDEDWCDYIDNDCDGQTDEDVDMTSDPANCGECDNVCAYPNAIGVCDQSECEMGDCAVFWWDHNESDTDGCEYFCQPTATDDFCDGVDLGDGSYIAKDNDCDGTFDEDVDFQNDPVNCGACMNVCQFLSAEALCVKGQCEMGECEENYYDLDKKPANGCEYHCIDEGTGELCDGKDNDCDGEVDEDNAPGSEFGAEGGGACYTGSSGCVDNDGEYTCYGECATGLWYCESAELRCKNEVNPVSETCNGLDDDCDEVVDDEEDIPLLGEDGSLCGNATGLCEQGHMRCAKPDLTSDFEELCCDSVDGDRVCSPPVQPVEIEGLLPAHCDGDDNDCDGFIDEDPNDPEQSMTTGDPCYYGQVYGQAPGVQLGECANHTGVWTCFWGQFFCEDAKGSRPEECDGLDNDCDGQTDEDLYRDCPDPGFLEVGRCRWGQQKCQMNEWGWGDGPAFVAGDCGNQIAPADEICNTLDDDCDDETDEPADLSVFDDRIDVPCGQGYCEGTTECDAGRIECDGLDPIAEAPCNLIDDDCNGTTDEWVTYICGGCDPDYGTLIGADPADFANCVDGQENLGRCQQGTWVCEDINGDEILDQVCVGTILPTAEICNGEDDDCDGTPDNDSTDAGGDCSVGICPGTTICNGSAQIVCDFPGTKPGDVVEDCNNQDDDCDGFTDENLNRSCGGCETAYCLTAGPGSTHDRGVGECAAGTEICDGAGSWGACNGSIPPILETCDNKDNDCDGLTDEKADGNPLTGSNCGPPCDDGVLTCQAGIWQCQGATVPTDDVCNQRDDDCNAGTPDGTAEPWFFTPCDGGDSDLCEEGVWQCVAGVKTCSDATGDTIETCDKVDNDCDGATDSDIDPGDVPGWVCISDCTGSKTPECNNGSWRCEYDCTEVECQNDPYGPPIAQESLCDGKDGDCDTVADDDFNLGSNVLHCGACDNACGTAPGNTLPNVETYYCGDYSGSTQCSPLICADVGGYTAVNLDNDPTNGCECVPTEDNDIPCNAVDEDCDGVTDMGTTEVCDGLDNDCDTLTDLADPDLVAVIPSWVCNDNCPGGVTETCVDTGGGVYDWVCDYAPEVTVDPGTGQPTTGNETLCDGIDNDCDSLVDDGIAGLRETCTETFNPFCSESGAGGCDPGDAAGPVLCCRAIDADNICTDEIVFSGTEVEGAVPNNVDEDCDGLTDEGTACADSVVLTVSTPESNTFDMFAYEASMYDATALLPGGASESVPCSRLNTLPWTMVNYTEARDACRRLNAGFDVETDCLAGAGCWDLCTEEQWQFACAAGTPPVGDQDLNPLLYPYGDYYEDQTCNGLDYAAPFEDVEQTGTLAGCYGEYGATDLFDMSGNVEEWTRTPRQGASSVLHVIRGGSYNDLAGGLTCTFDMSAGADAGGVEFRMSNLGFRCCRARKTGTCGPTIEAWNTTDPDLGEVACAADEWCPAGQCETCDQDQACWDGAECEKCPPYYRCGGHGVGCELCDQDTACEANCLDCADVGGGACQTHGADGDPEVWTECAAPPDCPGGVYHNGFCWFYGASNHDCNNVCDDNGYNDWSDTTCTYAGASTANCEAVIDALTGAGVSIPGSNPVTIENGVDDQIGCFYWEGGAIAAGRYLRLSGTNDCNERKNAGGVHRICACAQN